MNHNLNRIVAGTLLAATVAVAGFGLAAGTAQANTRGPYQWCPGQQLPETDVVWDMNVCHTWYYGNAGHVGSTNGQVEVGWRIMEGEPSPVPGLY